MRGPGPNADGWGLHGTAIFSCHLPPFSFPLTKNKGQAESLHSPPSAPWKSSSCASSHQAHNCPHCISCCSLLPRDETSLSLLNSMQLWISCLLCNVILCIHILSLIVNWEILKEYPDLLSIPHDALYSAWYTTGERLNNWRPTEPVPGKAAAHRCHGFLKYLCCLPNYNEAHYLGFKQNVFVPAIQKSKEKKKWGIQSTRSNTRNIQYSLGYLVVGVGGKWNEGEILD